MTISDKCRLLLSPVRSKWASVSFVAVEVPRRDPNCSVPLCGLPSFSRESVREMISAVQIMVEYVIASRAEVSHHHVV